MDEASPASLPDVSKPLQPYDFLYYWEIKTPLLHHNSIKLVTGTRTEDSRATALHFQLVQ